MARLTAELMDSFKRHSQRKETRYKATGKVVYDEFDEKPSKPLVDKIDRVLSEHYGLRGRIWTSSSTTTSSTAWGVGDRADR